jgi:hypothetical protein
VVGADQGAGKKRFRVNRRFYVRLESNDGATQTSHIRVEPGVGGRLPERVTGLVTNGGLGSPGASTGSGRGSRDPVPIQGPGIVTQCSWPSTC